MNRILNLFVAVILMFSTSAVFAANNNNNNNPVDCPPASMIESARFTIVTKFSGTAWFLFSRLNFKPNESWVLAFITQLDLNNKNNQQEALQKGQEKFQTLPISLIHASKNQKQSFCVYYFEPNNTSFGTQVIALNHMENPPPADLVKSLLK